IDINYDITTNTVLEFDFKSTLEGEIHFIGFDNDLSLGANPQFKLYGFQNTGTSFNEDFSYTNTGNFQHFTIPVGDYYTGNRRYLMLVADNDSGSQEGNSIFRNIKIYEDSDNDLACDNCPTVGDICDDGDACTTNDTINVDCNCVGTLSPDVDNDGLCAAQDPDDNDSCNPDDTVGACDTDNDGTPDGLDCAPNDPLAATIDACGICGGDGLSCQDLDNDGVFADVDPDDNNPCVPNNTIGVCDTDNDGTPDGLDCAPNDPLAAVVDSCNVCGGDGLSCQDLDGDGTFADIDPDDNNPCVPDNTVGVCDTDGDGVSDGNDICPGFDDNLIGTECDDGNPNTLNDVYTTNCICEGVLPIITGFDLYDANTDLLIRSMEDGDTIFFDIDGTDLNIEATIQNAADESAVFNYDGVNNYRTESLPPYAVGSDSNGDFNSWTPTVGIHVLEVVFYDQDNGQGNIIARDTLNFVVAECSLEGNTCDDGDDCTINDQYDSSCNCVGTLSPDLDNDGLCAALDPDDNDPCNPDNTVGACDTDNDGTPDGLDCAPNDPLAAVIDTGRGCSKNLCRYIKS
ncbi:MAG: hypothetical protein AAGK97_09370, partial [Bacteroidota bacterium]